jgi:uncharacterized protein involved in exopolysaccharide biosynthesis
VHRVARYLGLLLRWRNLIVLNTLGITALALVVSLVLPKGYTAVARLLPPNEDGDVFGLMNPLGGGLSNRLSRLRVGSVSEWPLSELMVGVLSSRTVMDQVAQQCSLARYYRIKPARTEEIRKLLAGLSRFAVGDEGIVTIAVEAKSPRLAADLANAYVGRLDEFLRSSNMSRGHNMRVFLERRLVEVDSTLLVAQESLRVYQERNHIVSVDQETEAAIDAYATLKSQAYVKQAELDAVSDAASADNPFVLTLRRELAAYQEQLRTLERGAGGRGFGVGFALSFEHLPAAAADFAGRYRDYRIQEEAFSMLSQQHEYAKVLEARDAPTLTVLDSAVPPQKKSSPKRLKITLAAFVFSLAMGVAFAFLMQYFESLRGQKPGEYETWQALRRQAADAVLGVTRLFRPRRQPE